LSKLFFSSKSIKELYSGYNSLF